MRAPPYLQRRPKTMMGWRTTAFRPTRTYSFERLIWQFNPFWTGPRLIFHWYRPRSTKLFSRVSTTKLVVRTDRLIQGTRNEETALARNHREPALVARSPRSDSRIVEKGFAQLLE